MTVIALLVLGLAGVLVVTATIAELVVRRLPFRMPRSWVENQWRRRLGR